MIVHQTDHTMLVESILYNNLPPVFDGLFKDWFRPAVGAPSPCTLMCCTHLNRVDLLIVIAKPWIGMFGWLFPVAGLPAGQLSRAADVWLNCAASACSASSQPHSAHARQALRSLALPASAWLPR